MSKWQIPAQGGNMEAANGIYYQNMTNKEVAERLKKNDVILPQRITDPLLPTEKILILIPVSASRLQKQRDVR